MLASSSLRRATSSKLRNCAWYIGIRHVFGNMLDRLGSDLRSSLEAAAPTSKSDPVADMDAWEDMWSKLDNEFVESDVFKNGSRAPCVKCSDCGNSLTDHGSKLSMLSLRHR